MEEHFDISADMLPFAMRELVAMVMQKKALAFDDALYYIYSSNTYKTLLDEDAKMWYLSTVSIYEMLEKEKSEKRKKQKNNPKALLFKTYCIENFRISKKLSAKEVLMLFTDNNVFDFLDDTFEMLHTQDNEYILDTICTYIRNKKREK